MYVECRLCQLGSNWMAPVIEFLSCTSNWTWLTTFAFIIDGLLYQVKSIRDAKENWETKNADKDLRALTWLVWTGTNIIKTPRNVAKCLASQASARSEGRKGRMPPKRTRGGDFWGRKHPSLLKDAKNGWTQHVGHLLRDRRDASITYLSYVWFLHMPSCKFLWKSSFNWD